MQVKKLDKPKEEINDIFQPVDSTLNLPVIFEAYSIDTRLSTIIERYKLKYGVEPTVFYKFKKGDMAMIAIEVDNALPRNKLSF